MKNALKVAAALALTGFCFAANAQTTTPMKDGKMESKTEEKMESKKMEMKENKMAVKGGKMHHSRMHHAKMTTKTKM
ncbi:MAG: hypothetical protein M3Y12_14075 [Bacteroidota bacterium]|nr:hypothetical protein [Bacteroidota bacterium]